MVQKANIDWLQFRLNGFDQEAIIKNLNLQTVPFVHETGGIARYDYQDFLEYQGVKIYYIPSMQDVMVQFTGKGCTYYQKVLESIGSDWREFLSDLIEDYPKIDFRRIDLNIDDFSDTPYFRPEDILKYCEEDCFTYGKSQKYSPVGTPKTGMTLYLGAPKSDHKAYIYDKMKERASQNVILDNEISSWIRLEARFLRDYAQEIIFQYIQSEQSLMGFIKGYFKHQFNFFKNGKAFTPRFWTQYLNAVEDITISIKQSDTELIDKIKWFFFGGGRSVLKAYDYLQKNNALPKFEHERSIMYQSVPEIINDALYTPELAKLIVKQLQSAGKSELIPEVIDQTKRQVDTKDISMEREAIEKNIRLEIENKEFQEVSKLYRELKRLK